MEQSPPALSLQEGVSYMLQCNFSTFPQSVNWYFQNPEGCILRTSLVAQMVKRLSTMWETCVQSLGWEDPLEKVFTCIYLCSHRCSVDTGG